MRLYVSSTAVGSLAGVSPSSSGSGDTVRTVVERPYFVDAGPRNVTAILGQPAILNCRVKHPGERTVSTNKLLYIYSSFLDILFLNVKVKVTEGIIYLVNCSVQYIVHAEICSIMVVNNGYIHSRLVCEFVAVLHELKLHDCHA